MKYTYLDNNCSWNTRTIITESALNKFLAKAAEKAKQKVENISKDKSPVLKQSDFEFPTNNESENYLEEFKDDYFNAKNMAKTAIRHYINNDLGEIADEDKINDVLEKIIFPDENDKLSFNVIKKINNYMKQIYEDNLKTENDNNIDDYDIIDLIQLSKVFNGGRIDEFKDYIKNHIGSKMLSDKNIINLMRAKEQKENEGDIDNIIKHNTEEPLIDGDYLTSSERKEFDKQYFHPEYKYEDSLSKKDHLENIKQLRDMGFDKEADEYYSQFILKNKNNDINNITSNEADDEIDYTSYYVRNPSEDDAEDNIEDDTDDVTKAFELEDEYDDIDFDGGKEPSKKYRYRITDDGEYDYDQ